MCVCLESCNFKKIGVLCVNCIQTEDDIPGLFK